MNSAIMPEPLLEALILGIIQGATEFLPVSSSAHLILFPLVFHWEYFGKTFDVFAHLGTLLALLIYFRKDICPIVSGFAKSISARNLKNNYEGKLAWFMLISTIPAAIFGGLMSNWIEEHMGAPNQIATMLILFAVFLFLADRFGQRKREVEDLTWADALLIGLAQALALMPGVSRSGITMTYALLAGFSRFAAARYSFLISIPVIGAAFVYHASKMLIAGELSFPILPSAIVIIVSTITGYSVIAFLLRFLNKHGFDAFVIYRILLGIVILFLGFKS